MAGRLQLCVLIVSVSALYACSTTRDLNKGKAAIATFHERLNAGLADAIYTDATPEYQKAVTPESNRQLITGVLRKLGKAGEFQTTTWNINYSTNGEVISIQTEAMFANGKATESFQLRIAGDHVLIQAWNINSPLFITN
jgi:hypothetical protein